MRPEPLILAFDTSAAHCAAALLSGDRLLTLRHEAMDKGQAERLLPLLQEVLAKAGFTWSDLSALAVGTGPGNFTGVRIAVAAARGLALSRGLPAFGVTALEATAFGLPRPVTVIADARRDEVYVQDFAEEGPGEARLHPAPVTPLYPATGSAAGPDALAPAMPLVEAIARLAAARLRDGLLPARPAPFYLRGADAAPPSDPPPVILPG